MKQTLKQTIINVVESKEDLPPVKNILSIKDLENQFENILSHFGMHQSGAIKETYNELLNDRYNPHYMSLINGFTNLLLLERDRAIAISKSKKRPVVRFEN